MSAAKELFSIDRAYDGLDGAGLPKRQRAAWSNDRKLSQTPLGLRSQPLQGPHGEKGDCEESGGTGHKRSQCPNHVAKKDSEWSKKTEDSRKKPCTGCHGVGHWNYHHNLKNENCYLQHINAQRRQKEQQK